VTTIAGTLCKRGSVDGFAKNALLNYSYGVTSDSQGDIYFTDGNKIKKMYKIHWTPTTHSFFPVVEKKVICLMTVLHSKSSMLHQLPKDIFIWCQSWQIRLSYKRNSEGVPCFL